MKSQDGDTRQTEKAEETEHAPAGEQQEADKPDTPAEVQEESRKGDAPVPTAQSSEVAAPIPETNVEKTEEEPGKEPEGAPEAETGDQEQDESRMHVLGHDDNIRTKSLEELPPDQVG